MGTSSEISEVGSVGPLGQEEWGLRGRGISCRDGAGFVEKKKCPAGRNMSCGEEHILRGGAGTAFDDR